MNSDSVRIPEGVIVVKDIVDRLWICPHFITGDRFGYPVTMPNEMTKRNQEERIEAAKEITRLRTEMLGNKRRIQDQDAIMAELWERIHALTAERDEARRRLCLWVEAYRRGDGTTYANEQGWDCFKEDGK
jgi:hypothetical protein